MKTKEENTRLFDRMVELEESAQRQYWKHNSLSELLDELLDEEDYEEYKKLYKAYYKTEFTP